MCATEGRISCHNAAVTPECVVRDLKTSTSTIYDMPHKVPVNLEYDCRLNTEINRIYADITQQITSIGLDSYGEASPNAL